jgi:hypothetical protein
MESVSTRDVQVLGVFCEFSNLVTFIRIVGGENMLELQIWDITVFSLEVNNFWPE